MLPIGAERAADRHSLADLKKFVMAIIARREDRGRFDAWPRCTAAAAQRQFPLSWGVRVGAASPLFGKD